MTIEGSNLSVEPTEEDDYLEDDNLSYLEDHYLEDDNLSYLEDDYYPSDIEYEYDAEDKELQHENPISARGHFLMWEFLEDAVMDSVIEQEVEIGNFCLYFLLYICYLHIIILFINLLAHVEHHPSFENLDAVVGNKEALPSFRDLKFNPDESLEDLSIIM